MTASTESAAAAVSANAGPRRGRRRLGFRAGLLAGVALVFALRAFINSTSFADHVVGRLIHDDTKGSADAIVVLGAGLTGPCEPNLHAVRRVMLAARLWREHRAPILLFTGGRPPGLDCSVAGVMSALAGDMGVPAEVRRLEEASRSTHENAAFSAPILRQLGVHRVLVVTDRLHMPRAAGTFAAEGFAIERVSVPVYASHADNVAMLLSGLREYAALLYYRQRGWLEAPPQAAPPARAAAPAASPMLVSMPMSAPAPAFTWPDGPIVILGASYAAGWKPARLGGHAVVNAGVPGEESWQMLARFDTDVLAHRPRAVVLWGFINDIHRAPKDRIDQAVTKARATFVTMIAKARAAGVEPIIATELTIRPPDTWSETIGGWVGWVMGKESYQAGVNRRVMETNAWLRDLARREGLLVLDLHPRLSDPNGVRAKAFVKDDGSHIPPAGYEAISAYGVPLLDAHLQAGARP